ncbi:hypothetical protein GCM10009552_36690 [Rothia nasimurium]|uniref:Dermonecrotic toxin N-terminal domain-containing protein n=1 Tax=Luteibacter anthropi TaxID=564369 RepID=A0A7X5U7J3_9GAMM|nr:DUF6543 domain-containing protein [Luteibacter anthropi]NII05262.1 hypothetical protein [Luteibacter anthropi]
MDALPPQVPPALVSPADQPALDAVQRLASTQLWLLEQQNALPAPPDGTRRLEDFLGELEQFWATSVEQSPGQSTGRRAAFAAKIASTALDDAILRQLDDTLAPPFADVIRQFIRASQGDIPPSLHASTLRIGETTYAGALVLADERQPGVRLLFTTHGGWEVFAAENALLTTVESRMREALAATGELPGIDNASIEPLLDGHFVELAPLLSRPFEAVTGRLIERFDERLRSTWQLEGLDDASRVDALYERLNLHELLDLHAMVERREADLVAHASEERLAMAPRSIRDAWRTAARDYHATLRRTAWNHQTSQLDEPSSMADVAREWLAQGLQQRGYEIAPDDIRIRSTRAPFTPDAIISTLSEGPAQTTQSLVQFAFRNTGLLPTELLTVLDASGQPRHDISASTIRDIVRSIDLPNRYALHLDAIMGASPEGRLLRTLTGQLIRARLRLEAADARLSYYDPSARRGFIDDHEERAFQWVQAVADHPASTGRTRIGGHELVVAQLVYRGAPLADIFLIGVRQAGAVSRVVLYTPAAPDGIALREFEDRAQLAREFLLKPQFESYLLDRLPDDFATVDQHGRHFSVSDTSRIAHWSLGGGSCGECTRFAEPFTETEVSADIFDTLYDTALSLAKRNAHTHARSLFLADIDSLSRVAGGVGDLVTPQSLMLTPLLESPFRIMPSLWRAYDNIKAGDHAQAFVDATAAYTAALNVVPLYMTAPASLSVATMRMPLRHDRSAVAGRKPARPDTLFESRYQAPDVVLPSGPVPENGVFALAGKQYIQQGGKTYHVRFDHSIQSWRLSRPAAPDARFPGPAIERLTASQWGLRRTGLRGGGRSTPYNMTTVSHWLRMRSRLVPHLRTMTFEQVLRLRDWLQSNVPVSANRIFRELGVVHARGHVPRISPVEYALWDRAVRYARTGRRSPPDGTAVAPQVVQPESPPLTVPRPGPSRPAAGSPAQGTSTATPSRPPAEPANVPPGMQRVPMNEWPDTAYYYSSPLTAELWNGTGILPLRQSRLMQGQVEGVPLLTLPPETPLGNIAGTPSAWMPHARGNAPSLRLGSVAGTWVRIDLAQVRAGWPHSATPFEVLRPSPPGSTALVVRPLNNTGPEATVTFLGHFTVQRWPTP